MTPETALNLGRNTLMLILQIVLPLLCIGLTVGVLISIVQAVTQIQEMTLTFVPKVVAMIIGGIFLMPYILNKLMTFATEMFGPMPIP